MISGLVRQFSADVVLIASKIALGRNHASNANVQITQEDVLLALKYLQLEHMAIINEKDQKPDQMLSCAFFE